MSKITVDTKILPITQNEIDVEPTGYLGDLTRNTAIKVLDSDVHENESYVDYLKRQRDVKNSELELLKTAFGLTSKQVEKINKDMEESVIDNYVAYLATLLLGLTNGTYKEFEKSQEEDAEETDPKQEKEED